MTPPAAAFTGVWASILLPFREDESIDFDALEQQVGFLAQSTVSGIYTNGTGAELHNQTDEEFLRISGLVAGICRDAGKPFQIGASHPFPVKTLERIRATRHFGPAAFQVILPDWMPVTMEEALAFLGRLGEEAGGIPLVVYNPGHGKRRLGPAEWEMVAREVPAVRGIKVAGGDEEWYRQMEPLFGRLSVFIPGHRMATGLARGAHGSYSNMACLNPAAAAEWFQLCRRDREAGLELEERVLSFMNTFIIPLITEEHYCDPAVDKVLGVVGGWCPLTPRLRWPYRWVNEDRTAALRDAAKRIIPEFLRGQAG